jgi:hypothetical protein
VHRHTRGADRVPLGLEAARQVDRQPTAGIDPAFFQRTMSAARWRQADGFVHHQFGGGEAVVHLHAVEIVQLQVSECEQALPGDVRTGQFAHVALRNRHQIVRLCGGAQANEGPARIVRVMRRHHDCRSTVGNRRTVGAQQATDHTRILLRLGGAERHVERVAVLRQRIVGGIGVILGRDARHRITRIAEALGIAVGDETEHAGEAGRRFRFFLVIGGAQQRVADVARRQLRHDFDTDDQHAARGAGADRQRRLMDRCAARGTGVLDAHRRRHAQAGHQSGRQSGNEALLHHAGAEMADHDGVDVGPFEPGVGQRGGGDFRHQAFDIRIRTPCKRGVGKTDQVNHGQSPGGRAGGLKWLGPAQCCAPAEPVYIRRAQLARQSQNYAHVLTDPRCRRRRPCGRPLPDGHGPDDAAPHPVVQ